MKVISPDWRAILSDLESWARDLLATDPAVLGALLFGSLARGDHAPGADADLLVVVDRSQLSPRERSEAIAQPRLPICHDLLVYTEAEARRLLQQGQPLLRRALSEGRWLATREGWKLATS